MKRLLAFSHAGVLEVNRALFHSMARVADVEVTLVVPRRWQGDLITDLRFEPGTEDRTLRVVPLPALFSGNGSLFFYAASLKNLVRQWKPDHVFIDEEPWSLAALQACLLLPGIQKSFFTKQNLKKTLPLPFRMIERWIHGRTHHAYSVADEVSEVLKWKGYPREIRYLPHSYDPAIFKALQPAERSARRRELGIPEGALVVSYFGRLTPEKGIDDLLEAIRHVPLENRERIHFLIVGNGPLATKVKQSGVHHVAALKHLEVGSAIGACDLLVLPSRTTKKWKEQYGRILVEAMACKVAVVGSDSGEIPNLIGRAGGGVVFPEGDVPALSKAITELEADRIRLKALAKSGHAYVQKHLTHDAVARSLSQDLGFSLR